jgi:hypothetical protein
VCGTADGGQAEEQKGKSRRVGKAGNPTGTPKGDFLPLPVLQGLAEGPTIADVAPQTAPAAVAEPPAVAEVNGTQSDVGEATTVITPVTIPSQPAELTEDAIQAGVDALVQKYGGKDLRSWQGFHVACREFGLQPKHISDERLAKAGLHQHQVTERMHRGIAEFNTKNGSTTAMHEEENAANAQAEEPKATKKGKKASKPAATPKPAKGGKPKATRVKAAKQPAAGGEGKLSLREAALQVMAKVQHPLSAKEIVEKVVEQGLWTPGEGKTPDATLAASFYVMLKKLGDGAPIRMPEKGKFELNR